MQASGFNSAMSVRRGVGEKPTYDYDSVLELYYGMDGALWQNGCTQVIVLMVAS